MLAEQRIIPLNLKSGELRQAVGRNNNAAWPCPCGRSLPLIGRAADPGKPGERFLVECPDCGRQFRVLGFDWQGRWVAVNEAGETAAGSRR